MGFFDWLLGNQNNKTPVLVTQMPQAALNEIMNGRVAILKTQRLILKNGEDLHYLDPAVLVVEKTHRRYVRRGGGTSFQGFFGMRHYINHGQTDVEVDEYTEQYQGMLYITSKRIIFQSTANSFDKPHTKLSAINPYSNAIELQYDTKIYSLFVPNGSIVAQVINIVT
jgi:hypothetical protein